VSWSKDNPSRSGWYWYREVGVNLDLVMSAFVFGTPACMYVSVFAVQSEAKYQLMRHVSDYQGEWCGHTVPE
jgi:hypothetical protein